MIHEIHSFPFEQYDAADGVSNSMLKVIADKTPMHLRYQMLAEKTPPTEAQRFGTIMHRAMLEPDSMDGAFYVKPQIPDEESGELKDINFATKDGKAWKKAHLDKPIVTADDVAKIQAMVASVTSHPTASKLFRLGKAEQSIFVKDGHGTLRKGRLDWLSESGNILPDLKTCESAAPEDFEKDIFNYGYFRQAAYYLDLCELIDLDKTAFAFVCVEKTPPYAVAVYDLMDDVIEAGRRLYQRDIQIYRNCLESGKWPGYSDGISSISIPAWAMKRLEIE